MTEQKSSTLLKLKNDKYFDKLLTQENQKVLESTLLGNGKRYILYGSEDQWKAFVHAYSISKYVQLPYKKTVGNYWNSYKEEKVIYITLNDSSDKDTIDKYIDKWNGLYPFDSYKSKFDKEESYTIFPMEIEIFICLSPEGKEIFKDSEKYEDFKSINLE